MAWLSEQFKNQRLFRRSLIVFLLCVGMGRHSLVFQYAHANGLPGLEVAAVITAIQAPVTVLLGYLVKLYTGSADKDKHVFDINKIIFNSKSCMD